MNRYDRNKQSQIWADINFKLRLKKIKAQLSLKGIDKSMGAITKDMINCPSFEQVEKEILNIEKKAIGLRLDKRRIRY